MQPASGLQYSATKQLELSTRAVQYPPTHAASAQTAPVEHSPSELHSGSGQASGVSGVHSGLTQRLLGGLVVNLAQLSPVPLTIVP